MPYIWNDNHEMAVYNLATRYQLKILVLTDLNLFRKQV